MTNEEAIKNIVAYMYYAIEDLPEEVEKAFDVAITALKARADERPQGDLISRDYLKCLAYTIEDKYCGEKQVVDLSDINNAQTVEGQQGDLISRAALKKAIETYDKFACLPDCKLEPVRNLEHPEMFEEYVHFRDIIKCIDNAPTVEESCKELQEIANHLRDRIKDIDHEIMIPQSDESKCFLDGKRKAFQYVLDLLEVKKNEASEDMSRLKKLALSIVKIYSDSNKITKRDADILHKAITTDRPQGEWIPVSERLPEEKLFNPSGSDFGFDFEEVLCTTIWGDVRAYKFGKPIGHDKPHFWLGGGIMDEYVIAWQYKPEPYKEGGKEK